MSTHPRRPRKPTPRGLRTALPAITLAVTAALGVHAWRFPSPAKSAPSEFVADRDIGTAPSHPLLGCFLPALTLGWAVFAWRFPWSSKSAPRAFVADSHGRPRVDVVFVGPDGSEVRPDARGIVVFPRRWVGHEASIRDAGWRQVGTVVVCGPQGQPQQILALRRVAAT